MRKSDLDEAIVNSERLRLREADDRDADFIIALLNEPGFIRYIGDRKIRNADDARVYIGRLRDSYRLHGFGLYIVELKHGTQPIGICGLLKRDGLDAPDIGFAFRQDYEARGYAYEAAAAILADARQRLGIARIVAITTLDNVRSMRLLGRLGFRRDGEVALPQPGDVSAFFVSP